jgi:hypothetical protein
MNLKTVHLFITPEFGMFLNHKRNSNMQLLMIQDGDLELYYAVAIKTIYSGEEITVNYDGKDIPNYVEGSRPEYTQ